jgi:hypothetical protein
LSKLRNIFWGGLNPPNPPSGYASGVQYLAVVNSIVKGGVAYGGRVFILIPNFMKICKMFLGLLGIDRHKNTNRLHDTIILYNYTSPYRKSRLKHDGKMADK